MRMLSFFKDDLFNPDSNSDGDFSNNIAYGHASGLWELEQKAVMKLEMRNFYDDGLIVLPSGDMNLEGFFVVCCRIREIIAFQQLIYGLRGNMLKGFVQRFIY